jgi:SAM-dependent methyltransferase
MNTTVAPRLLNLGCGHRTHPAWSNVDLVARRPDVLVADLSKGIPFPNEHFDGVYHSAMLEHLRRENVPQFMRECRRVLKPRGVLRIAVPDLENICRVYLQKLEAAASGDRSAETDHDWMTIELLDQSVREHSGGAMMEFLRQHPLSNEEFVLTRIGEEGRELLRMLRESRIANTNLPSTHTVHWLHRIKRGLRRRFLALVLGAEGERALQIGRFRLSGEAHHWMYDRVSLTRRLREAGFSEIQQQSATTSRIQNWLSFHLDASPDGVPIKPDLFYMEALRA